jgi:hypothetical protein
MHSFSHQSHDLLFASAAESLSETECIYQVLCKRQKVGWPHDHIWPHFFSATIHERVTFDLSMISLENTQVGTHRARSTSQSAAEILRGHFEKFIFLFSFYADLARSFLKTKDLRRSTIWYARQKQQSSKSSIPFRYLRNSHFACYSSCCSHDWEVVHTSSSWYHGAFSFPREAA